MIYLHYKDTKTFGHSFSFLLIFKTLRASYLQVGNFSNCILNSSNSRYFINFCRSFVFCFLVKVQHCYMIMRKIMWIQ